MTIPTDISGLSRWYRASSLGLADNSPVATWTDESGNGAHLTASGSARPTYVTGRWNGLGAVVFNGSTNMSNTSSTARPASDVTVLSVMSHYKRGSVAPVFIGWGSGTTSGWNLYGNTAFDANQMPPSMICLKGSGTWGHNQVTGKTGGFPLGRGDPFIVSGFTSGTTTGIRVDEVEDDATGGDSGTISYGASPTLMVGDKGPGNGPFQGAFWEIIIYNGKVADADILSLESYLDSTYKITQGKASVFALYNGEDTGGSDYKTGLGWSPDSKRWKRYTLNPVHASTGGLGPAWESQFVKDQWLLNDGSQNVMYYSGFNASNKFQIGRATSSGYISWSEDSSNPLIALGSAGSIDEGGCSFPVVVKDANETDATRVWKMWYAATDGSGKQTVAYAHSSNGVSWTKYGKVIDVGSAGSWEAVGVIPGCIWRTSDGTWYLFYGGRKNSAAPSRWQGGVATFTNPESTYTKFAGNPTLQAMFNTSGASQALTANLGVGDLSVSVASTSTFVDHMPIYLDCINASQPQLNRILKVASTTSFSLEWPVEHSYTVADGGRVVPATYNSVTPRGIHQLIDGTFELSIVPFQPVDDVVHTGGQQTLREMGMRATIATLTSNAVIDYANGLFAMVEDSGTWNDISAENWGWLLANGVPPQTLPASPYIHVRFKVPAT